MTETKAVEIDWQGAKAKVTLKRLTFGEYNQLQEEAVDIRIVNGQPLVKVNNSKLTELALLKSIIEAPFTIDISNIRALDPTIGNQLFGEWTELNSADYKKKG
jgi:hypothetical protein